MRRLLYFPALLLSVFLSGAPEPLTSRQKEELAPWNNLCEAIRSGDADSIGKLWKICSQKGLNPATAAHDVNNIATLKVLEKLGLEVAEKYYADPYGKFPFKQTIIQSACLNGYQDIVEYLLTKDPQAINKTDEWTGGGLLHTAIVGRSLSFSEDDRSVLVKMLIDHGAEINAVDRDGETALMAAALRANVGSFKVLIVAGASDTIKNKKGESVDDLLRDLKKREDCVEEAEEMESILLKRRKRESKKITSPDYGLPDGQKATPVSTVPSPLTPEERWQMSFYSKLYNAIKAGDINDVKKQWAVCKENKIDISGAILGVNDMKTLKVLEGLGADIDNPQPVYPFNKVSHKLNVLQAACMDGHVEIIRYMLTRSATNVRIQDKYHRTLLYMSVMEGWTTKTQRPEIVRMLIDKGVDLDEADDSGMTPLMGMVCVSDVESFKMLLDAGAAIDIKDKEGKTVDDYIETLRENEENRAIAGQMRGVLEKKKTENRQLEPAKRLIDNKPKSLSLCADDNPQKCTVLNN